MATKLQIRRDTASNWTSANPTLSAGELGFETDTSKLKIGNGSTAWTSLGYFVGDVTTYLAGGNVQHIIPAGNELYDLGDSDSRFRDLYLSGSTIKLGSVTLSVDSASNALVLPAGTQLGNVAVLDSAGVQNVISQTYVRNNQIQYNTADFADSAFVTAQINNLIDAAPGALNTLNELAAALGDDANFSTTITNQIAGKLDSAATTTLIDSSYVQARQTTGGSVDSAATISLINSNTNSGFSKFKYTATAGQTVFQDSDASGNILSFDPNSTIVFYNGVMLDETTDYTASNNAITLTSGADAGVSLSVVKFGVGYVAPTYWYGDRGLWIGGINNSNTGQNVIDYIDITSTGNATDFGDLSNTSSYRQATVSNSSTIAFAATGSNVEYVSSSTTGNSASFGSLTDTRSQMAGVSDATTGCFGGGSANVIDKITIATPGNATDFGDLTVSRSRLTSGKGGTTRGLFIGGGSTSNVIDYITIATAGNAIDFGDITSYGSHDIGGAGNDTRVLYAAGQHTNNNTLKRIEYVNPATTGNGSSFGNVSYWSHMLDGANNQTRACWSGYNTSEPGTAAQNHIEYVTIDTTGDASDFGDLTGSRAYVGGASGNAS